MFGLERRKKQETRKTFQVAPIWQLYGAGWRMLEIIILVDLATHSNTVVDNGRRCRALYKQHCVSIQTHHLHNVLSPFHCSTWIFLLLQHWTTCCHLFTTKKNKIKKKYLLENCLDNTIHHAVQKYNLFFARFWGVLWLCFCVSVEWIH